MRHLLNVLCFSAIWLGAGQVMAQGPWPLNTPASSTPPSTTRPAAIQPAVPPAASVQPVIPSPPHPPADNRHAIYHNGTLSEAQLKGLINAIQSQHRPITKANEYPWYAAADVAGAIRETRAIPVLISFHHQVRIEWDDVVGKRSGAPNDYPAIIALARIGLPAVQPIMDEILRDPGVDLIQMGCVLSRVHQIRNSDQWIDAYVAQSGIELNDDTRTRIRDLKGIVRNFHWTHWFETSLPGSVLNRSVVQQRNQLIQENIHFLETFDDQKSLTPEAEQVIETLGNLRATEAVQLMVMYLLERQSPQQPMAAHDGAASSPRDVLAEYPAARALVRIGSTDCIGIMGQMPFRPDQEQEAAAIFATVLCRMMPPEVALQYIPMVEDADDVPLGYLNRMNAIRKQIATISTQPTTQSAVKPMQPGSDAHQPDDATGVLGE